MGLCNWGSIHVFLVPRGAGICAVDDLPYDGERVHKEKHTFPGYHLLRLHHFPQGPQFSIPVSVKETVPVLLNSVDVVQLGKLAHSRPSPLPR